MVVTSAPLGETPVAVDAKEWEGIWVAPEETYVITVLDEAEGRFLVSELSGGKSPKLIDPTEMKLSKVGDWRFANWEEEPGEFRWIRVYHEGDHIILWWANFDGFAALVDQGVLPGDVRSRGDEGKVFIGPLTDEHLEIITESSERGLFYWEAPVPLYRVTGPDR